MRVRTTLLAVLMVLLAACGGSTTTKHGAPLSISTAVGLRNTAPTSVEASSAQAAILHAIAGAAKGRWRVTYKTEFGSDITLATDGVGRASIRSNSYVNVVSDGYSSSCNVFPGSAPVCTRHAQGAVAARAEVARLLEIALQDTDVVIASAGVADQTSRETVASRSAECFTFRGRNVLKVLPARVKAAYAHVDLRRASRTACFDQELGILVKLRGIFSTTDSYVATAIGPPSDTDFADPALGTA
ncbi:MAG: hypothetical protein JWM72_4720 [Actinomycetia bacterium]|nr:hypothetical protein [Actinomycetes bacterium]